MSHTKAAFRQVKPTIITVVDGTTITDGDFNVLHYANAAACIQAAFDSIKTLGGTLRIRSGSYSIGTEINTSGQTQAVVIEGEGGTVLTQAGANYIFNIKSSGLSLQDMTLMAGNFAADVIFGQSTAGFLGYLFLNKLNIVDVAANALNRKLINILENGTDELGAIEIQKCIFSFNNLTHEAIEINGFVSNIEIHDNYLQGKAYRGVLLASPGTVNRSGGGNIRIFNNSLDIGEALDASNAEGIVVEGWREFLFIYDNITIIRGGVGPATVVNGISIVNSNMTVDYSLKGSVHNNIAYLDTALTTAKAFSIGGPSPCQLKHLSIIGNTGHITGASDHIMSFINADSLCVSGNMCSGGNTLGSFYCFNVTHSTIDPNQQNIQQTDLANATNSYNVQEQISKLWAHLTCGGAGAVTIDRDYNIASASYAGTLLTVNFDRNFNSANNYALLVSYHAPVFAPAYPVPRALNTGSCVIQKYLPTLGGGSFASNNWAFGDMISISGNGTSAN